MNILQELLLFMMFTVIRYWRELHLFN